MLHLDAVTCIKQERCLFENLSFSIKPKQIIQLEGANGAGKTSLLRILAGFDDPDEGGVYFNQQAIKKCREDYAAQLLFIGHKTGVNSQLTAIENCQFWLTTHGYNYINAQSVDLYEILNKLGLLGLEDIPVRQLSAGQQRRVALARLWMNNATLWLLDEPFTAVDKKGVALLQQRFSEHLAAGGAILLTSHQDLSSQFSQLQRITLEYRL